MDHERRIANFVSGVLVGVLLGAAIAVLTAPEAGRRTRRKLRRAARDLRASASRGIDHLADDVREKTGRAVEGAWGRIAG